MDLGGWLNIGWNNQAVSLIILTEAATGFSGMFGYSPAVGLGSLIFSIAAASGVDNYGNSYPQGVSSAVGAVSASSLLVTGTTTVDPGPLLVYGNTNQVSTVIPAGASGNWTAPTGITSVTATLTAGGGDGFVNSSGFNGGGGGGECAVQTFTVVPTHTYAYSVGTNKVNTTFITATANAGKSGTLNVGGLGGSGSGAPIANKGGNGGPAGSGQDGGGGSSGGPTQPGNNGGVFTGGAAVPGGGAGGQNTNGGVPGGGAPGNEVTQYYGGGGQLTLNYAATQVKNLLFSMAAVPGSDTLGNSWVPGFTIDPVGTAPSAPGTGCVLYYNSGTLYALGPSGTIATLAAT